MTHTRTETDSLGPREVPADAYYGIQTLRAVENFPVSGLRASRHLVRAYGLLKAAAARANVELGGLDERRARAIIAAAEEVAGGRLDAEFPVDVFQAGAGTSFHMNVNEVIANRALELLGEPRGAYTVVGPNDQVNRGQSTNDTFPTAAQVATLLALRDVAAAVRVLSASLRAKGDGWRGLAKGGRTHLKDAMPVSLGAEFRAYATALDRSLESLPAVERALAEVPLGGSAVGSGVNSLPGFRAKAVAALAASSGLPLVVARDPFEAMQSRASLAAASSWLRNLAGELIRLANDLRLLSSGPATGFDEIRLPEIQPGSSIMPAKVNPSAAEALDMIAFHVIGADVATSLAVQAGQLEINVMMPLAAFEVLFSAEILARYLPVFARTCVDGIEPNAPALEQYLLRSTALATVLTPRFGYLKVAEILHEASRTGTPVKTLLVEKGLLTEAEVESLLGKAALARLADPVP
ncbi:MAG TPA: aspartate ammonia-lyase [Thermoplasmata archaeon]|nr:aspartate ammonia-lyase [Thermoplasmata archaeon]